MGRIQQIRAARRIWQSEHVAGLRAIGPTWGVAFLEAQVADRQCRAAFTECRVSGRLIERRNVAHWVESGHCSPQQFAYSWHVARYIALVVLSAFIGSGLATMMWVAWKGGTGAPNPAGFVMGMTLTTMFFTVPGAVMLMGLQAGLIERGIGVLWRSGLLLLFAALAGAAVLSVLSFRLAALGSAYALSTAFVLLALQRLLKRTAQR